MRADGDNTEPIDEGPFSFEAQGGDLLPRAAHELRARYALLHDTIMKSVPDGAHRFFAIRNLGYSWEDLRDHYELAEQTEKE